MKLPEQELDNTPPIRQIGAIPSDLKAQLAYRNDSRVVVEGQ